jgi:hypothetical protein
MVMVSIAVAYTVDMVETAPEHYGELPEHYDGYEPFIDEFDLERTDRKVCYLEVRRALGWLI